MRSEIGRLGRINVIYVVAVDFSKVPSFSTDVEISPATANASDGPGFRFGM